MTQMLPTALLALSLHTSVCTRHCLPCDNLTQVVYTLGSRYANLAHHTFGQAVMNAFPMAKANIGTLATHRRDTTTQAVAIGPTPVSPYLSYYYCTSI